MRYAPRRERRRRSRSGIHLGRKRSQHCRGLPARGQAETGRYRAPDAGHPTHHDGFGRPQVGQRRGNRPPVRRPRRPRFRPAGRPRPARPGPFRSQFFRLSGSGPGLSGEPKRRRPGHGQPETEGDPAPVGDALRSRMGGSLRRDPQRRKRLRTRPPLPGPLQRGCRVRKTGRTPAGRLADFGPRRPQRPGHRRLSRGRRRSADDRGRSIDGLGHGQREGFASSRTRGRPARGD